MFSPVIFLLVILTYFLWCLGEVHLPRGEFWFARRPCSACKLYKQGLVVSGNTETKYEGDRNGGKNGFLYTM